MKGLSYIFISACLLLASCNGGSTKPADDRMVSLITLDPGHFHAALVQKSMYANVSPVVHVYAQPGADLEQHLARINAYNTRVVDPTSWKEIVYRGDDFLSRMLSDKAGNVVVLAGNNRNKAEYIKKSIESGLNVLSDKPMIIDPADLPVLQQAFRTASAKGLLLYDIMTERYEIATILQKELSQNSEIFGQLTDGTKEDPAVTKESIHHFSKIVSGSPLIRPAWFFDTEQQGEGITDVTTHLVDLVQWECFSDRVPDTSDIHMVSARRWETWLSSKEFREVTGLDAYPGYLKAKTRNDSLGVYSNGSMTYSIKGKWVKVSVEWRYRAPEGGSDTHYSVMKGTNCDLVIRQSEKEKYLPELYIENIKGGMDGFRANLTKALSGLPYDSLSFITAGNGLRIVIPSKYRVGHEAHFAQVTAKFLEYLKAGKLPEWEVQGMLTKYYTTMSALKMARGFRTDLR
ncbi:MAG: putative oxidoreductase C-terminal domain-containing protein [Bacteroidales bacterium]